MGEFSPPLLFFNPSNIEIIFNFSDIITKIHPPPPPFQNPGSALAYVTVSYDQTVKFTRTTSASRYCPLTVQNEINFRL